MPVAREFAMDPHSLDQVASRDTSAIGEYSDDMPVRGSSRIRSEIRTPETFAQGLMEAAPFQEPPLSLEELEPLRDAVVDALHVLNERERWIVYARIWRGMSVRNLGKELALSKSHVDRIFKVALRKLGVELESQGITAETVRCLSTPDLSGR